MGVCSCLSTALWVLVLIKWVRIQGQLTDVTISGWVVAQLLGIGNLHQLRATSIDCIGPVKLVIDCFVIEEVSCN